MPKESYYRKMFFIGAIWNWVATVSFAFGYPVLFPWFGMKLPLYPVFLQLFLGLAFIFGIGYYWVSRNIYNNHAIVKLGIIGKIFVFLMLLVYLIEGSVTFFPFTAGVVDLIFAILFIEFLIRFSKNKEAKES